MLVRSEGFDEDPLGGGITGDRPLCAQGLMGNQYARFTQFQRLRQGYVLQRYG